MGGYSKVCAGNIKEKDGLNTLKRILIINEKYKEAGNQLFSQSPSIIDLPPQIAEVLINNDMTIFKAISWCMFPIIWAGDTLKIEPIKPKEARIGDILLYKCVGLAFAHRLVKTYTEKDKLYIVTSGEREFRNKQFNNFTDLPPDNCAGVVSDNVLGKVTEIKRGRLSFKPNDADEGWLSLMQGRLRLSLWILKRRSKQYIAGIFIKLQSVKLYRYCFRGLIRDKISFLVGAPLIKNTAESNNFRFYQTLEDFLKSFASAEGLYNISARINNKPVGNISLFLERIDNRKACTLSDFRVRIPFRGLGIGSQLLRKALYLCNKVNIDEVKVVLSEEDKIACGLFKKLGFF